MLPAGTIQLGCADQAHISRTTTIYGSGMGVTILQDSCPTGDSIFVTGDYIDNNGDVRLVVNGVRDFTFNDGWIGSNANGGAIIGDTVIGTAIIGNTFTNYTGPSLIVTQISGPVRVTSNLSSLQHLASGVCDAKLNGVCFDLNTQ